MIKLLHRKIGLIRHLVEIDEIIACAFEEKSREDFEKLGIDISELNKYFLQ